MSSQKFKMRCHYDVLGVDRDAEDGELKKAYRKLALEWHPDKNQHRIATADTMFKEIRGAYETLSDPNERAWYDSHREAILRSGVAGAGDDARPEDEINLMPYFNSNCFRGFEDDESGFFRVYGKLFAALDDQEQSASLAANRERFQTGPAFGSSNDDWNAVKKFYNHWSAFSTQKTFAWADEYNLAEADTRKVRRLMDEENRKLRRFEVKEFNDTVRQLVAFIRKRDKRFVKRQLEKAKIEKESKAAAERQRAEARKLRAKKASEYQAADWTKQDDPQWLEDEIEKEKIAQREKAESRLDLFCPVCRKRFKSQKQWENHEQSKQHKAQVLKLKEEMMADEEVVRAAMEGSGDGSDGEDNDGPDYQVRDDASTDADAAADDAEKLERDDGDGASSDDDDDGGSEEDETEEQMLARMMGHARVSKTSSVVNDGESSSDDDAGSVTSTAYGDRIARNKPRKMLKKNKVGRKNRTVEPEFDVQRFRIEEDIAENEGGDTSGDDGSEDDANAKKTNLGFDLLDAEVEDDGGEVEDADNIVQAPVADDDEESDDAPQKAPTKKSRRAKKGKQKGNVEGDTGTGADTSNTGALKCTMCRLTFTSGNALHKHLKEVHSGTHKKKK